jgi:hypothetical protein
VGADGLGDLALLLGRVEAAHVPHHDGEVLHPAGLVALLLALSPALLRGLGLVSGRG